MKFTAITLWLVVAGLNFVGAIMQLMAGNIALAVILFLACGMNIATVGIINNTLE